MGKDELEEIVTKWLIEEGFTIKKLDPRFPIKVVWGLEVRTPPPLNVGFRVFKPQLRPDRLVLMLGVAISPEHLRELERLDEGKRFKFFSRLLLELIKVCNTCNVVIEPSPFNPRGITATLTLLEDHVKSSGKQGLLNEIYKILNVFIAIISYFNEVFPHVTLTKLKGREGVVRSL